MADQVVITSTPSAEIEIDPALQELLQPVIAKWELAAARVASEFASPQPDLPVDSGGTPEELLKARFDQLPGDVKVNSRARAIRELGSPRVLNMATRVLNLPDGSGRVTFPQRTSIETVPPALPKVLTGQEITDMANKWLLDLGLPPTTAPAQFPMANLHLKLVRIHCVDETNGFAGSEAGMDEIELGGQAIDPTKFNTTPPDFGAEAATTTINAFRVQWKFNDGTEHDWTPPKTFHTFDLSGLNTFPATYTVTMLMAEVDSGSFQATLNKILAGIKDEVIAELSAGIGALIGTPGGFAGAALGAAVGFAVGKVFEYVSGLFDDVVFNPVTLQLTIPSANAVIATPSAVAQFRGPGHYVLRYDWAFS